MIAPGTTPYRTPFVPPVLKCWWAPFARLLPTKYQTRRKAEGGRWELRVAVLLPGWPEVWARADEKWASTYAVADKEDWT